MSQLNIGIAGLGRMGAVHARNLLDLERRDGVCRLTAVVDADPARTSRFAAETGFTGQTFASLEAYLASGVAVATMLVTPTENHHEHAAAVVRAGHRVILEKPLTGTLEGDAAFCAELDRDHPDAVMLAFQRRFDPALAYGRELMLEGAVGRVFKIYSALEDSGPPPPGYRSGGILPDMSVHNVDEILWMVNGPMPDRALAVGSLLYNHRVAECVEDFDDAMLYLWFGDEILGQVQVTRNHVSGYRIETIIYGEKGQIQIGHFDQRSEIVVEAFGKRGASDPIARRVFPGGPTSPGMPEFVDRFGAAYRAEAAAFVDCCRRGAAFPTSHRDGLRAQRAIAAGMRSMQTRLNGHEVEKS